MFSFLFVLCFGISKYIKIQLFPSEGPRSNGALKVRTTFRNKQKKKNKEFVFFWVFFLRGAKFEYNYKLKKKKKKNIFETKIITKKLFNN